MRRLPAVLILLILMAATPASAPAQGQDKPRAPFQWSVTFAPIRLINPILELDVERRVRERYALVGFAAGGKTRVEGVSGRVYAWEVGAQAAGYVLGDFERGMMVALEVVYVSLDTDTTLEPDGIGAGPLAGYKIALPMGLTVLAQAGVTYFPGDGVLHNNIGLDRLVANLNLGLGWSF